MTADPAQNPRNAAGGNHSHLIVVRQTIDQAERCFPGCFKT
jgi:hypothetical protein